MKSLAPVQDSTTGSAAPSKGSSRERRAQIVFPLFGSVFEAVEARVYRLLLERCERESLRRRLVDWIHLARQEEIRVSPDKQLVLPIRETDEPGR